MNNELEKIIQPLPGCNAIRTKSIYFLSVALDSIEKKVNINEPEAPIMLTKPFKMTDLAFHLDKGFKDIQISFSFGRETIKEQELFACLDYLAKLNLISMNGNHEVVEIKWPIKRWSSMFKTILKNNEELLRVTRQCNARIEELYLNAENIMKGVLKDEQFKK